jgi:hypothetical protein
VSLLRYMKLCMYFSKKPYKVFLEFGGCDQSDVLIKKSKARVRKYHPMLHCLKNASDFICIPNMLEPIFLMFLLVQIINQDSLVDIMCYRAVSEAFFHSCP